MSAAQDFATSLGEFVSSSPSSFHAVATTAKELASAGFTELDEQRSWQLEAGSGHYVIRDGALIAFALPEHTGAQGFRIIGAHTDSPTLKLKPSPDIQVDQWSQAGVEIYGGPLLNSWLDRELCFAGRLVCKDGSEHLVHTGPLARIAQLAIHLDRTVNDGLKLDRQQHVQAIIGSNGASVSEILAHNAGLVASDIVGSDVVLADTQPARLFGADHEFLASARLDNLSSVFAGLHALLAAEPGSAIPVLAAFDHEEIGSTTRAGAAGPFLEDVLSRIAAELGGVDARVLYANSVCLSSDAGHLLHPNYQGHHDPVHRPQPGNGPLLKLNANQRYATDAPGARIWEQACAAARVPYQHFVMNNQLPSGSTIGPITATRLGIRTVDVGLGLLSMHSVREMCQVDDLLSLKLALQAFLGFS